MFVLFFAETIARCSYVLPQPRFESRGAKHEPQSVVMELHIESSLESETLHSSGRDRTRVACDTASHVRGSTDAIRGVSA